MAELSSQKWMDLKTFAKGPGGRRLDAKEIEARHRVTCWHHAKGRIWIWDICGTWSRNDSLKREDAASIGQQALPKGTG